MNDSRKKRKKAHPPDQKKRSAGQDFSDPRGNNKTRTPRLSGWGVFVREYKRGKIQTHVYEGKEEQLSAQAQNPGCKKARGERIAHPSLGTPDAIRTHDLQSRSLTLYPTELRAHIQLIYYIGYLRLLQGETRKTKKYSKFAKKAVDILRTR